MARPFRSFRQADVFFALPTHWVEQHHTERRDDSAVAGSEWPKCGRRTLACDYAGRFKIPHLDQCHQRNSAIRTAAGRVEINRALATWLDAEQPIREIGFAIGEIADDRNFNRSIFLLAVGHYRVILVVDGD